VAAAAAGESGVDYITLFDASQFPLKSPPKSAIGTSRRRREARGLAVSGPAHAFRRRRRQAGDGRRGPGLRSRPTRWGGSLTAAPTGADAARCRVYEPARFGVYTGSGEGQQDFHRFTDMMVAGLSGGEKLDVAKFIRRGMETLHPITELEQERTCPPATWPASSAPKGRT